MRGIADILDALAGRESPRRSRRKETKVGERFDDVAVHAPRRAIDSSDFDRRFAESHSSTSTRRLALPSSSSLRRLVNESNDNARSFDRPRTPGMNSTTAPWKRAISAPRALSEVNHESIRAPTASSSTRSYSSLSRRRHNSSQRFYAPNEKPQPRARPRIELPPESLPDNSLHSRHHSGPIPSQLATSSSTQSGLTRGQSNGHAHTPGFPISQHSYPSDYTHSRHSPQSQHLYHVPEPRPSGNAVEVSRADYHGRQNDTSAYAPQRFDSSEHHIPHVRHAEPLMNPAIPSSAGHPVELSTQRARSPFPRPHSAATDISSDTSPPGYRTDQVKLQRRSSSKRSKKRPPALVTNGAPHGFAGAGLREATPALAIDEKPTLIPLESTSHPNLFVANPPISDGRPIVNLYEGLDPSRRGSPIVGSSLSSIQTENPGHPAHPGRPVSHLPDGNPAASGGSSTYTVTVNRNPARPRTKTPAGNSSSPLTEALAKSNSRSRLHYSSKQSAARRTSQGRALTDRSSPTKLKPMSSRSAQLAESDLLFEEATSLSSFGESDTLGRRGKRSNAIFEDGTEVCEEDVFVIGTDAVFKGGGFVIGKLGMLKSPGNLTRKLSDGTAVDGVPRSSNNLIMVRSLAEFSRGTSLSRRSKKDSTLGAGAAGRVSLAIHRPSGRKIAVKRINVFDEVKRIQLLKELETLMSYDSRFLVRSYGAFYDGEGVVHVTLEYMDRGALSDAIETFGPVPEHVTVHIAEHCLRGLKFLHDNRVLHRDFKTSNILLSRRVCRAKLSDFGLARDVGEGRSRVDSFVGTLAYMSPERLAGHEYTYASDVWGLGICVLECMLGRYPFPRPQSYFDYLEAARSNPSASLVRDASAACVDFVRLCTAADPRQRPTVRALLKHRWITESKKDAGALREWLEGLRTADGTPAVGNSHVGTSGEGVRKAKERAVNMDRGDRGRVGMVRPTEP